MKAKRRVFYESPTTDVVELRLSGLIAASEPTEDNQGVTWNGSYE